MRPIGAKTATRGYVAQQVVRWEFKRTFVIRDVHWGINVSDQSWLEIVPILQVDVLVSFTTNDGCTSFFCLMNDLFESLEAVAVDHWATIDSWDISFRRKCKDRSNTHARDLLLEVLKKLIVEGCMNENTFDTNAVLTHVLAASDTR